MTLGQKIKELRMLHNTTPGQLAQQLNIAEQEIFAWEGAKSLPDVVRLVRISEIFNVSTDYLLRPSAGNIEVPEAANGPERNKSPETLAEPECNGRPETPWWETQTPFMPASHTAAAATNERENPSEPLWDALLYPVALLVYLVIGFVWGMWHPGWLVFTAAWALEEIIKCVKLSKYEFYGVATMVFFVMGFGYDLWRVAWAAYIVAAIVEGIAESRSMS